jgi:hypothetical protein
VIADMRAGDWRRPALLILILAAIAMGAILVWAGRGLTFWLDEWDFIFARQDGTIHSFIAPHVDAFVLVPAAVYYVVLHGWGMSSYYPILVADWLAHFLCVALLALIITRKSGVLLGLMAGLSLLFLGSAYEALLQPFQMQYLFSAAGGLFALYLLDRDRRGTWTYVAAAAALLVAIASSGVGPIVSVMLLVWAVLRRDRAAVLVPLPALVAYGIWYVAWQSQQSRIPGTLENLSHVPLELIYGIGAAVAGVIGLPPMRLAWLGAVIALAIGLMLEFLVLKGRLRPAPLAVAALAALAIEYGLHAVFRGAMGLEHAARSAYLYPAAIFIWLAVAGTLGRRLDPRLWTIGRRPRALALIGLLIVPMALANMTQFFLAARALHVMRATEARELTLMERLREVPGLAVNVSPDIALLGNLSAKRYFAAIDQFGAPHIEGVSDELPGPDSTALNALAMNLLGDAIRVGPDGAPGPAGSPDEPGCTVLSTKSGRAEETWSPTSAGLAIRIEGSADFQLSAGVFPPGDSPLPDRVLTALARGETIWLPALPEPFAWTLTLWVTGEANVHVCARE